MFPWLNASAQLATHACAGVGEPLARLACYDRTFPQTAEARATMAEQFRRDFGLEAGAGQRRIVPDKDISPEEIEAALARVDHQGSQRIFTLDSGQVWTQTNATASGNAMPGEKVRIRKAMLGSYMLVMPSGATVRVKRTR